MIGGMQDWPLRIMRLLDYAEREHGTREIVSRWADGSTTRMDRYNWVISSGPEARSVTSRLEPARVMEGLDDQEIAALFRRSMRISAPAMLLERRTNGKV